MTQAQILQAQMLGDFMQRLSWTFCTNEELMQLYRTAVETHDGKNIEAIRKELNYRSKYQ